MNDRILVIRTDRRELLTISVTEGEFTYGETFQVLRRGQLTFRQSIDKRVVGELSFDVRIDIGSCGVIPPDLFKGRFDLRIGDGNNWRVLQDCVVDPDSSRWDAFRGTYESSHAECDMPPPPPQPQRKPDPSSYNSFLLGL